MTGSELQAGGKASLKADGAITLQAAQNSYEQHSSNQSSGASVGVGFAVGGTQNGFTLELAANKAKGKADGTETTWTNSHVSAGQVELQSGGDTSLKGAVIRADQVSGQIGGNLNIESLQDQATYDAKQMSAGFSASICVPPFCYGASTVSASYANAKAKAKAKGNYQSVMEQSGIKAGDQGFQLMQDQAMHDAKHVSARVSIRC